MVATAHHKARPAPMISASIGSVFIASRGRGRQPRHRFQAIGRPWCLPPPDHSGGILYNVARMCAVVCCNNGRGLLLSACGLLQLLQTTQ